MLISFSPAVVCLHRCPSMSEHMNSRTVKNGWMQHTGLDYFKILLSYIMGPAQVSNFSGGEQ